MVKTNPKLTLLPQSFNPRPLLIHKIIFNGNQTSPLKIILTKGTAETVRDGWEIKMKSSVKFVLAGNEQNKFRVILS